MAADNLIINTITSSSSVKEGESLTFTINTSKASANTWVRFQLTGTETDANVIINSNVRLVDAVTNTYEVLVKQNEKSAQISIKDKNDNVFDGNKTLGINVLDNFTNSYGINGGLTTKSALTTILDDDDIPKVTLKTTGESVSEGGTGHLMINLDHVSTAATTVTLQLSGNALDLAKAGGLSVGGQPLTVDANGKVVVSIPALGSSVDISVKFDNDRLFSGDKSLSAKILSANTNNTNLNVSSSGDGAASIKVKDVPPTVNIQVTDANATVVEKGDIHYKITLSTPSNSDTVIKFALNGTASKGIDYSVDGSIKSVSDDGKTYYTITIPKGGSEAVFTVHANEDFVKEGSETVVATITSAKTNGVQLISSGEDHDEDHDDHDDHEDHDDHSSISSAPSAAATITDFNHAATFDSGANKDQGSVTEDAVKPTLSTNGKLTVTDLDANESSIVKNSATPQAGTIGSLTIDENGNWSYSVDNDKVQYLGEGEHKEEVFIVKSADGTEHAIAVTIAGTNDAAVIAGTATGEVTELGGVANGTQPTDTSSSANGTLTISDVDSDESFIAVTAPAQGHNGTYGNFTLSTTGEWTYSLDNGNDTVQALNTDSAALTDSITVHAADGTAKTISVTIRGTNDAAVIAGTATGEVTELGGVANGTQPTDTSSSANGTLTISDVDSDESFIAVTAPAQGHNGTYGNFTLSTTGEWTYSLDNGNDTVQALNTDSAALTDSITVHAADGTAKTISVTIRGTNDAPTVAATLADQRASNGTALSYTVPAGTFADVDNGDVLTLSAKLADGSDLPSWLDFDVNTGKFSGTPPATAPNTLDIEVTATDLHQASVSTNLHFVIENDGILATVENAVPVAPGGVIGDGNGDGFVDSLQSTVASLPTTTDLSPQTWVTIEAGGNLSNVSVAPAGTLPAGVSLPFGEVNFSVSVPTGVSVDNSVYLTGTWTEVNGVWTDSVSGSQINGYWKQGADSSWNNVATNMGLSGGKLKIDFTLTDGDPFSDQDGTVNGTIVDPGGPGFVNPNRPVAFVSPEDSNVTANSVAENSAQGTFVNITAHAVDPDAGDTVTYSLVNSDSSAYTANQFQINSSTGVVSTGSVALNYEAATSQTIYVQATSSDGSTAMQDYTVAVTNVNESVAFVSPEDSNVTANSVAENSAQNTSVKITANAVDPDAGDTVTYSLVNSNGSAYTANLFQINSSTGIVSTGSVALNYEAATSQTIYVKATSSDGSTAMQNYTVAVTNLDEAAGLKYGSGITISTNSNSDTTRLNKSILESFLKDPEGGSVTFSKVVSSDDGLQVTYKEGVISLKGSGTHSAVLEFADAQGNKSNVTVSYLGAESTSGFNLSSSNNGVIIYETAETDNAILRGGVGDDILIANGKPDQLWGGLGNDTMTGSGAADKFVFNTTPNALTNVDTITDFASGDKLWFSKTIFTALAETGVANGTTIASNEFATGSASATTRFIYDKTSGALSYDADGSGAGEAVQVAVIGTSSHPNVAYTDIQVIV